MTDPINYIHRHPFSIMALSGIIGDLCFMGFAFSTQNGWVSIPKLGGALFMIAAQIILLAYGDSQAKCIETEPGVIGRIFFCLRNLASRLLQKLPDWLHDLIRVKPICIGFVLLSLNGLGLLLDTFMFGFSNAKISQILLGSCITTGCWAYALADCVKKQRAANLLLKIAPLAFTISTFANAGLAFSTHNIFMIISLLAFLIFNFAGFCTKIDKGSDFKKGEKP